MKKNLLIACALLVGLCVSAQSSLNHMPKETLQKGYSDMLITPSFTPGLYNQGDGKDLGHLLEFKSEVQISLNFLKNSQLGFSYNHLSNASLGGKNPGANSYMFNFFKTF